MVSHNVDTALRTMKWQTMAQKCREKSRDPAAKSRSSVVVHMMLNANIEGRKRL
jgi:hypothetical protein